MTAIRTRRLGAIVVGAVIALGCVACSSSTADAPATSAVGTTASASVIEPSGAPSTVATSSSASSATPSVIDVPTPPPAPSSAPLDPEAQEMADRAAVEAAWTEFLTMSDLLPQVAEANRTAIAEKSSVEPTLTQVIEQAAALQADGLEVYGASVPHPYWEQSIQGSPVAVMGDCTDTSQSGARSTSTGEIKTVGVARNNTRVTFFKAAEGAWKVQEIFYLLDIPC